MLKYAARDDAGAKYCMRTSAALIGGGVMEAYLDLGKGRIAAMDEAGVDMQVLPLSGPQIPHEKKRRRGS